MARKTYLVVLELDNGKVLRKIYTKKTDREVIEDIFRLKDRHKDHIESIQYKELK